MKKKFIENIGGFKCQVYVNNDFCASSLNSYHVSAMNSYYSGYDFRFEIVSVYRSYDGKIRCTTKFSNSRHHLPAREYSEVKKFLKNLLKNLEEKEGFFELLLS